MKALIHLATLAFMAGPLLADEPRHVRLWAPITAGSKQQVKLAFGMKVDETATVKGGDPKTEKREYAARLEGVFTELQVTRKGMTKEGHLKISKAEYLEDGEKKSLFKEGDEIVVKLGDATAQTTEVNGQPASKEQALAIRTFFMMAQDETPSPAEMYHPEYPVLPGEKWEVNRNKMVMAWQQNGYPVDSESTKGTVTFVGPGEYEGKPANSFDINYSASAKDFRPYWAPEGTAPMNASYEGKISGTVAVDDPNAYGQTKQLSKMRLEFGDSVEQGAGEKREYKVTQITEIAARMDWQTLK
jgi:hypothetical protein